MGREREREAAKSNCAPLRATGHLLLNTGPLFYFVLLVHAPSDALYSKVTCSRPLLLLLLLLCPPEEKRKG